MAYVDRHLGVGDVVACGDRGITVAEQVPRCVETGLMSHQGPHGASQRVRGNPGQGRAGDHRTELGALVVRPQPTTAGVREDRRPLAGCGLAGPSSVQHLDRRRRQRQHTRGPGLGHRLPMQRLDEHLPAVDVPTRLHQSGRHPRTVGTSAVRSRSVHSSASASPIRIPVARRSSTRSCRSGLRRRPPSTRPRPSRARLAWWTAVNARRSCACCTVRAWTLRRRRGQRCTSASD
jgi:hypothetical protein